MMQGLVLALASGLLGCSSDASFAPPVIADVAEPEAPPIPSSHLEGRVCSPSGLSWVGAATVRVRGTTQVVTTNSAGRYRIDGLQPGEVTLDITKGSFSTTVTVAIEVGGSEVDVGPSCLGGEVSIAVVVGHYDAIENLLADLGLPYTLVEVEETLDWLRDPESLADYDMVFFNCGMRDDWVAYPEVVAHLRGYVNNGGSIYASDRAYAVIEEAFPEAIDFLGNDDNPLEIQRGVAGEYVARVDDPGLEAVLGADVADIRYDFRNWTIATGAISGEPLLRAPVLVAAPDPTDPPTTVESVLAARARIGQGTVVFTSFHNQTQTDRPDATLTRDMLRILEDVILGL